MYPYQLASSLPKLLSVYVLSTDTHFVSNSGTKMDMDIACPRCKTTKYRNPSLKLMVNVCGHGLCESCVDLLFLKGELFFKSESSQ